MVKNKILLVDDDADDQIFFLDALSEIDQQIKCVVASNGAEALHILDEQVPDLIFLDLNMPVMNGFDFLSTIRKLEECSEVPVIIFTTASDVATVRKTHELGADAFFKKPNDFSTMRSKLDTILNTDFTSRRDNLAFSPGTFSF